METTLKHAGDVVFSDVDLPLPMKLVALAAVCWLYLAPVWLVVEARRGKVARSVAIYLTGVTLGSKRCSGALYGACGVYSHGMS